jgi:hypothetical protein
MQKDPADLTTAQPPGVALTLQRIANSGRSAIALLALTLGLSLIASQSAHADAADDIAAKWKCSSPARFSENFVFCMTYSLEQEAKRNAEEAEQRAAIEAKRAAEFNAAKDTVPSPDNGGNHPNISAAQQMYCLHWQVALANCYRVFHGDTAGSQDVKPRPSPLKVCLLVLYAWQPGVFEREGHREIFGSCDACRSSLASADRSAWRSGECREEKATERKVDNGFPLVCTESGWCERRP